MFEDGLNIWRKECVKFRKWLPFDKSHVAGWYHSPIMQGPDPKPIWTGATIHSLVITHGDLALYKAHVQVFGGKMDGDLGNTSNNTITIQKWVNLLSVMLDVFKNNGHCATMDSAYMGDIMAMMGRDVWRINMVGCASELYRSRHGLYRINEEGDVRCHLLAARLAVALFCHAVQQRPCPNVVKFPRAGDPRCGDGCASEKEGQEWEAGEA